MSAIFLHFHKIMLNYKKLSHFKQKVEVSNGYGISENY